MEEALAQKYGWDYVRYLETPYILKVKVLSKNVSTYKSFNKDEISLQQVDLSVKIEEIVKGYNAFKEGEEIVISYLPIWYSDCDCPIDFSVGSTYLIPLRPWYFKHNKSLKNLMIKNIGMEHFYKIEHDSVTKPFITNGNFSDSWDSLKKDIKRKYILEDN